MKKYAIIAIALLIFFMPIQQTYLETNAAIWSKAASKTAVKAAKEIVSDMAINKTANVIADTSKHINDSSKMVKEGHMLFCMDYTYKPGEKCNKAASVKQNLTDTDKANIKRQSQTEIEKLTSPSGKGFTKWQKFLDWFVPVWLVTFAVTAISYAISPDVKSLFDEAAYNTLVALGFIAPLVESEPVPIDKAAPELNEDGETYTGSNGSTVKIHSAQIDVNGRLADGGKSDSVNTQNLYMETSIQHHTDNYEHFNFYIRTNHSVLTTAYAGFNTDYFIVGQRDYINNPYAVVKVNGETVFSGQPNVTSSTYGHGVRFEGSESLISKKITSIRNRMPYEFNGYYYTDALYMTAAGDIIHTQLRHDNDIQFPYSNNQVWTRVVSSNDNANATIRTTFYPNNEPVKNVLLPDFEQSEFTAIDNSSYQDDKGNIAVLPPAAFTYVEESTGEQVERKQAPNGDGYVWQKPDGTEVPEENVIPKEEEEPKITPSPDGTPQYTPAPTPSNPEPEPVPLTPQQPAPEPEPTPDPTDPTIPDGQSCSKDWDFPDFEPLKETMSDAFPFSIPWDMQNALESAFGDIGTERPSFDLDLKFMGNEETISITMPKFFDDWKPFTDSLLLFIFDIGIMFGIYRFMKGGSS